MSLYLDDPREGWDDWIKRAHEPKDPQGPAPPPWLTAAGDFDEEKHPRDEKGRFGPGDGTKESDVERYDSIAEVTPAPGFSKRLGNCYEEAARYVIDTDGTTLVHGTIKATDLPAIRHAWAVNPDGSVYDAVLRVRFHPDDWEKLMDPVVYKTYGKLDAVVQMAETEVWGPWDPKSEAHGT